MTVSDLLSRCTSAELSEWMAYFNREAKQIQRQQMDQKALSNMNKIKNQARQQL